MIAHSNSPQVHSGASAVYRIKSQGYLESSWAEQFGELSIEHSVDANDHPQTILTGEFIDQAALIGILNSLYNLGFVLICVTCIENEE